MYKKSIAFIWVSLIIFILVLYVVLRVFVMRSFVELENQSTLRNVDRLLDAITERTISINSKASDWAAWDDAYQFVQDGNSRFIRSNIVLSAFTGNNLNLIAYVRNSDEIVYARWYLPGTNRPVPIPEEVRRVISRDGLLTSHRDVRSSISGIVMLDQGPMLVASRPVITSDEEGPIRGSLIFGQLLDAEEIQRLSYIIHVPVVIKRLDGGNLPVDFAEARTDISESGQAVAKPISRRVVAGYTMLDDIYSKPALILRVETPRTIYDRGLTVTNYALAALVILSILFGTIGSLLLVRTIQKEQEFDLNTREFYRRTITAATNGKLIITSRSEIEKLAGPSVTRWEIRNPADLSEVRNEVFKLAKSAGIVNDAAWKFTTCVGEAVANAIKHASGGVASLHRMPDGLLFVMSDQGPGIPALTLPDVALRRGYSTAGTLGMGYKIMILLGDRVYLVTGPEGTIVAIEMKQQPEKPSIADI